MKNYFKSENGITLVALIITVIVILILISITFRMTNKENIQITENKVENEYYKYEQGAEENIDAIDSEWHRTLNPGVDNKLITEE